MDKHIYTVNYVGFCVIFLFLQVLTDSRTFLTRMRPL